MSARKLKSHLHAHARRRALERYGVQLTKELRREIIRAIGSGDEKRRTLVKRESLNRKIFDVPISGRTYRVVYDCRRSAIATFLPLPGDGSAE